MTDIKVPGPDHPISIEATGSRVTVRLGGRVVAETDRALTLHEAGHPPAQYLPLADVDPAVLVPSPVTGRCAYKGEAAYWDLRIGEDVAPAALWGYPRPNPAAAALAGHVSFHPDRVDTIEVQRDA